MQGLGWGWGEVLYLENGQCLAQRQCSDASCPSHVLLRKVSSGESGSGPQGPGGRYPSPIELGCLGAQAPGREHSWWPMSRDCFPAERPSRTHGEQGGLHASGPKQESHVEGFSLQEFFICDPVLKTSESSGRPAEDARTEGRSH